MKAVVLAGGFAKRMWPLTKDEPKHLLPIAKRPMLDYVLSELEQIGDFDKVFITTNAAFENQFKAFLKARKNKIDFELVIEPSSKENEKLGSVGALGALFRSKKIDEPVLIIGGDNLFDSSIVGIIKHLDKYDENIILLENVKPKEASLYGIVSVDKNNKITSFEEKPSKPKSNLAATACYILTKEGSEALLKYLDEGRDPDKLGHFIEWLITNHDVYGFTFLGKWFDVGSLEEYRSADSYFKRK